MKCIRSFSSYFIEQEEQIQEEIYENMKNKESTPSPKEENNEVTENNSPQKQPQPQQQIYETIWINNGS